MPGIRKPLDELTASITEEDGRMVPRPQGQEGARVTGGPSLSSSVSQDGLKGDKETEGVKQDTPGRPKTASSRQQTQPEG